MYPNHELYIENQTISTMSDNVITSTPSTKTTNVVRSSSKITENEIAISETIKQIPFFFLHFQPVINYKKFKIAEIDDEKFEKCKIVDDNKYCYLLQYNIPAQSTSFADFFTHVRDLASPMATSSKTTSSISPFTYKKLIAKIIQTFKTLMNTLTILDKQTLVHMNITPHTILIQPDHSCVLTNFSQSFLLKNLNSERTPEVCERIKTRPPPNIYDSLEHHLLYYLLAKDQSSLSMSNIDEVVHRWHSGLSLSSFAKYINSDSITAAIRPLHSLINKPKNVIINALLSTSYRWNMYSLHIIYLQLLSCFSIYKKGQTQSQPQSQTQSDKFIGDFSSILLQTMFGEKREDRDTVCSSVLDKVNNFLNSITEQEWNDFFSAS